MERLDHDGDGKLDFEEFQKFIKPKKKQRKLNASFALPLSPFKVYL